MIIAVHILHIANQWLALLIEHRCPLRPLIDFFPILVHALAVKLMRAIGTRTCQQLHAAIGIQAVAKIGNRCVVMSVGINTSIMRALRFTDGQLLSLAVSTVDVIAVCCCTGAGVSYARLSRHSWCGLRNWRLVIGAACMVRQVLLVDFSGCAALVRGLKTCRLKATNTHSLVLDIAGH